MKKRIVSLFMMLVMVVGVLPAFAIGADATGGNQILIAPAPGTAASAGIPDAESTGAGQLSLSNIGMDIAYRLVFPDGSRTSWSVRGEYDEDVIMIAPLDGGDYYLEVCPLSALTVVNAEEELPIYRYDLWTNVPASQIRTSEKIAVAQSANEGDNIVDLAEGEVLLAPSYNDYALFLKDNNIHDSEFDFSAVADGPAVEYVSTDNGATWKKLTGNVTITSSSAEPVENGVSYALYCGADTTTITLDSLNTTGTINTPAFCHTDLKIKGDVTIRRIDTEQLGTLTVLGAGSDAKLTVTRAVIGGDIEIKDLAELTIKGTSIAINNIMGDLKLTNIKKMDISVSGDFFPSCIRSYEGNVILTNVYGTIELPNAPEEQVFEVGTGKKVVINTDGAYVYAGTDSKHLEAVTLQAGDVFPMDKLSACITITAEELPTPKDYRNCLKDELCPIYDYTDAGTNEWYHDGVHYCIENGIMGGYGNGIFAPGKAVTRQQVWMTLARISGEAPANSAEAREWAMETGVSDGTNPTGAVTRQQFITMLYRYAVDKGYDVSVGEDTNILSYDDVFDVAEYAIPAVQWGCGSGVMGGYGDGTLKPVATTTRAHLAAFLQRFCENVAK